MKCPNCSNTSDLADWLERVEFANSAKKWITSTCPACGKDYELRLQKGSVVIGVMEGAPGPYFIPYRTDPAPGLARAEWTPELVRIQYKGRRWKFRTHTPL